MSDESTATAASEAADSLAAAQTELAAIQLAVANERKVLKATRKGEDSNGSGDPSAEMLKELSELKSANAALKAGVSHDEVKKQALELNKEEAILAAANLKAVTQARDDNSEALTTLGDQFEALKFEKEVGPLALSDKIGVKATSLEDALEKYSRHWENRDGKWVLKDADAHKLLRNKDGDPVDLVEFGKGWLRDQYPDYFAALSGAGSRQSDGVARITGDARSSTQKIADGLRARA